MRWILLALLYGYSATAWAEVAAVPAIETVNIEEHLGQRILAELPFTDSAGHRVALGEYLNDKPVVLILANYKRSMPGSLVLQSVAQSVRSAGLDIEDGFRLLTISIDPSDNAYYAQRMQQATLAELGRPGETDLWPFLTGEEGQIRALADRLGVGYSYDPRTEQFAHPAVVFVLGTGGVISRYLYGLPSLARDLRLALLEASQVRTRSLADRILLACYHYDPATRTYGPFVMGFLRLGGLFVLALSALSLIWLWAKEKQRPLKVGFFPQAKKR